MTEPTPQPFAPPSTPRDAGHAGPSAPPAGPYPAASDPSVSDPSALEARPAAQAAFPQAAFPQPAFPSAPETVAVGRPLEQHPGDATAAPPAVDSFGRPLRAPRRRSGWLWPLTVVVALVAGAAGGVAADRLLDDDDGDGRLADAGLPAVVETSGDVELTGVAAIADAVLPSVVAIEVRAPNGNGTGSGFVLRADGYILTNSHVVAPAAAGGELSVLFADGSEEPAELIGRTGEYDLAVIKVDREGLTPLVLGDSDAVVVGQPVVAIGAPLGLEGTVTQGIVSALNRPVMAGDADSTAFINAIQTDAAINPGNSGGPLVNTEGEVIGINSAIAQSPGLPTGGNIGVGFAIPSNQARRTAEQLIETGEATYPAIGALLDTRYVGEGVQVATEPQGDVPPLTPDGPADRAGIKPGDVILAIDGRPVTQPDEFIVAIRARAPGDSVTLTVRDDDGEEREVRVVLTEMISGADD